MLVPKLWLSEEKLSQIVKIPQLNDDRIQNRIKYILIFICFLLSPTIYLSAQTNDDCYTCHSDNELTMEKNGREISLFVNENLLNNSIHKNLSCVSCHVGFDPDEFPHKENILPVDCKLCHSDAPLQHPFHPQMMQTGGRNGSDDVSCKNCHGTHNVKSPVNKSSKWHEENLVESCADCHSSEAEEFKQSDHAPNLTGTETGTPGCITCHQNQITSVTAGRDTLQLKIAQQNLCLSCHLDDPEIRSRTTPSTGFIQSYEQSIHGIELGKGNKDAAACIDCHNSHLVINGNNPESSVNKFNISNTCGKCHAEIAETFEESIHGKSLANGNIESPTCTDCHGEHNILKHDDPESPVAFRNVSQQVCSPCHSSVQLTEKFGIASNRYKTFEDSYHGLALRGGSMEVANCASCHGVHNIKPSSDPTSMVSKQNLPNTCGSCHPGANENFAVGKIHVTLEKDDEPILYWISYIYIILIISIIGGMIVHNIFDFIKKAKIKKLKQRGLLPVEHHGRSLYLRMTLDERIQHLALTISFITLVITGFMLRFPDSWWVSHIRDLSENAFEYRSNLHRIAAVVLIISSLYHVYYVSFTQRGRKLIKDLFPVFNDLTEAIGVAKFNLGLSEEKPKLGRFSYIEKAEYWALVWGTIVMSVTGILMWFDNTFIGLFTKLGWDIARTIHYYEAWLATLAIIVWHFYFVIFNPDVYPMNMSWITGKLTEEEMADEHPGELEEIKKKEASERDIEEDSENK